MTSMKSRKCVALLALFAMTTSAIADKKAVKPEDKPGYDATKDLGVEPPEGADLLFDGTQKSIDDNWVM